MENAKFGLMILSFGFAAAPERDRSRRDLPRRGRSRHDGPLGKQPTISILQALKTTCDDGF
jgi:hypothetical protein